MLSLKISVVDSCVVKTMQFDPTTLVFDACRVIREKVIDTCGDNKSGECGLFLSDEDSKRGVWLETGRTLDYYLLRNGDLLEYKPKQRKLKIRMLDESVKTVFVDDSHTVSQIMITICSKIGITNHDEYSLVRDLKEDEKMKTLTIKRKEKSIAKDQKKMDELMKKLHTDDELDWLDHSRTLREQGIDPEEMLLLRRKYFFSDQNVDARDPVQLNLLYVQTRDAIIKGAHPINQEEAIHFAGIQCQIQFGDHVESKHKSGFLDLKELLPKEYVRVKGIEKKIFLEHKKFTGQTEVEAKAKYTQQARSLKTYGITFFLVKEKMKGKNKLVPRLLGITKESVVRVDENTKEILKTWKLTTVKRWAASPNSFTLDFGDYSDSYYSVQTLEGEQIAQLISGYIDIILKKKQAAEHMGIDVDDESMMYEDSVAPKTATTIQHRNMYADKADVGSVALPAVLRVGEMGDSRFSVGSMQSAQFSSSFNQRHAGHAVTGDSRPQVHRLEAAQRALLCTISEGLKAISDAQADLSTVPDVPNIGNDQASQKWLEMTTDLSKQKVESELCAMNAATAQIVSLTSGPSDEVDYAAVGSAVHAMFGAVDILLAALDNLHSANLREFTKDTRTLASLNNRDKGASLLDAARALTGAFSDFLDAAQPNSEKPRNVMLSAAGRVGDSSREMRYQVDPMSAEHGDIYKDKLDQLIKAVATSASGLVKQAKQVASRCQEDHEKQAVITSATLCGSAASELISITRIVSPTIDSPDCQEQVVEVAKHVAKTVDDVMGATQDSCNDPGMVDEVQQQSNQIISAVDELIQFIKQGPMYSSRSAEVHDIFVTTERLLNDADNPEDMIRQAHYLAQATSLLVNALQMEANQNGDSGRNNKLIAAANALAEATNSLLEAAKGCADKPDDAARLNALKAAAESVRAATTTAAQEDAAASGRDWSALQQAAKNAASAATQVINVATAVCRSDPNEPTRVQLLSQCRAVGDEMIVRIVRALRATIKSQNSPASQLQLLAAVQDFIPLCSKMLLSVKAVLPTVTDQSASIGLQGVARNLTKALDELRNAASIAQQSVAASDIDVAIDEIRELESELNDLDSALATNGVITLPGHVTGGNSSAQLSAATRTVGSLMAQLLTAAVQGDEGSTNIAARNTSNALRTLTDAVRGVIAGSTDRNLQSTILQQSKDIIDKSVVLLEETKSTLENPGNPESKARLAQVAKLVSQALNNCVSSLPGVKEVDQAAKCVSTVSLKLSRPEQFVKPERSISEIQIRLNNQAAALNEAACNMSNISSADPQLVASSSSRLSAAYEDFIDGGVELAGATQDQATRTQIVTELKNVSIVTSKLLLASKSVLADPTAPNAKSQLAQAARAVTESLNSLIGMCTMSSPGEKECDGALRQLQALKPLVNDITEPLSDKSYFDCLDSVSLASKNLADAMSGISSSAKNNDQMKFTEAVALLAAAVCDMIENGAQAAYLIGVSDPASERAQPGVINQMQYSRTCTAIQHAYESLADPTASKQQMLAAAAVIAKQSSALGRFCHDASQKVENPASKQLFYKHARDVTANTVNLVKAIKILESDFNDQNRKKCLEAAGPLMQAVEEVATFTASPEFASVPARITDQGRAVQKPVIRASENIISQSCLMVESAKLLISKPKDPNVYQQYSSHTHGLSESIKNMVSAIRDGAPGHKECDKVLDQMNRHINELDQASLTAINSGFVSAKDGSHEGFQDQVINCVKQMLECVEPIRKTAKAEPENLGHFVLLTSSYMEPLTRNSIGCASNMTNSKLQLTLLDQSKTVIESMQNLIQVAKECGGNTKAVELHAVVDEMADSARDTLQELLATLEEAASSSGFVLTLVDDVNKAISQMDVPAVPGTNDSYVAYQTDVVHLVKQVAIRTQEIRNRAVTNVTELGSLANALTRDYLSLTERCMGAICMCPSHKVAESIKLTTQALGRSCIAVVQDAGNLQNNENDSYARRDLTQHSNTLLQSVTELLSAIQSGSRGTQACINAATAVSGIIADLDTTVMFAQAGTLQAEANETFANHRDELLRTAKALVEDTKTLVAGAAANDDRLSAAAESSVKTITDLAECVKRGAAALGSQQPQAQVLLINAVKDVASALSDLIDTTKNAAGKPATDVSVTTLKESARVMVTNVTSLLKTVKTVEDEASRGTQALESSIEVISQELKSFQSTDRTEKSVAIEVVLQLTKPLTIATAKAVAAGNSGKQDDIIMAANLGRKAVTELLRACKGSLLSVNDETQKQEMLRACESCCSHYQQLLQQIHLMIHKATPDGKLKLTQLSKQVAAAVSEIVHAAEAIKGTDWVDSLDPTAIAETELLSAANSIEAAAKKLANLEPRRRPKQAAEDLKFEEQIVEAAKSIAAATAALVKAASYAQKELVAQGKIGAVNADVNDESQWSEGLVSAARMVAAATHSLCDAANALVQGQASEEKLISSAKLVAASTTQLLCACMVKADQNSPAMRRLQMASNAVKKATEALVREAQNTRERHMEDEAVTVKTSLVSGMAEEIKIREMILMKEKELEQARRKLANIHKAKYTDRPSTTEPPSPGGI